VTCITGERTYNDIIQGWRGWKFGRECEKFEEQHCGSLSDIHDKMTCRGVLVMPHPQSIGVGANEVPEYDVDIGANSAIVKEEDMLPGGYDVGNGAGHCKSVR
jgi:hypothetical protein